jgi:methanethiol S-methyltransferase
VWAASGLFIVVCALWRPVPGLAWDVGRPWSLLLGGVQIAGLVLTARASARLDVLSLAGLRQAVAAPSGAPPRLIDDGVYRLVRHPIYFAWILMVWPAASMTGTRLVFAAVSTLYLAAAIPFEERSLNADFGPEYARYRAKVRWRMVPGIYSVLAFVTWP